MNEIRSVERLPIHDLGTLRGLTRWIGSHVEGVAEWIKNVGLAYQEGRANVKPEHRCAVLLFKDSDKKNPSRIGVLDVGGLSFEDVKSWSVWNDPDAASRGGPKHEETQGNGGKAYSYQMFCGPSYMLGVQEKKQNQVGFIGKHNSLERGFPRYYPATENVVWQKGDKLNPGRDERDIQIDNWQDMLVSELVPFKSGLYNLPSEVIDALKERESFTIAVGENAIEWSDGVSNVKNFIKQLLLHSQSQRAVQQVNFYVIHNGKILFNGKPLKLEDIEPFPSFEGPFEYQIPEILLASDGHQVNTKKSSTGKHPQGKITIYTSKISMEASYKTLKPRWIVNYRTQYENVGQKYISEIVPGTPGSHYIYATVDLDSLNPDSVDSGRKRPNDTRLVSAVDLYLAEKITEIATRISALERQDVSKKVLKKIEKEHEFLNKLKNEFLPPEGGLEFGKKSGEGKGKGGKNQQGFKYGSIPSTIKLATNSLKMAQGVTINLTSILRPTIRDENDLPVKTDIIWKTDRNDIISLDNNGNCKAVRKGICDIIIKIKGTDICAEPVKLEIVKLKDVFLSPRELNIKLSHSKQIIAQISTDEDKRYSDVILEWQHDASDQNLIKISPRGYVFGNKIGTTSVNAGSNSEDGIWANNWVSVEITPSKDTGKGGSGFPTLKLTDCGEIDPFTGREREGDPDAPALWQEWHDQRHNIWWLNLQSKDAHYAYDEYEKGNQKIWRIFYAKILVEMVVQAHLQFEYSAKKEGEAKALWSDHKNYYDRKYVELTKGMWEKYLEDYVRGGMTEVKFTNE